MERNRFSYAQIGSGNEESHCYTYKVTRVNYLKNHTGIVSALILGVAIVSGAFLLNMNTSVNFAERAVASPSSALRTQIIEKDSDGDGLLDWEETLWGTDPFVIDSDGDGILDGEFVASRKANKTPEEIVEFESLSFTSQFSRTFFAEYLQYQSDGELTEVEKNALIARLANSVVAELPEAFPLSKVKTIPVSDEALVTYFRSIVIFSQKATPEGVTEGELTLLEKALDTSDPDLLSDIGDIALGYGRLSNTLALLPVPETLRANHSALVTATARLSAINYAFANTFNDAVYSLAVLPEYQTEAQRLLSAFQVIDEEISKRETITNNDEVIAARQALGL